MRPNLCPLKAAQIRMPARSLLQKVVGARHGVVKPRVFPLRFPVVPEGQVQELAGEELRWSIFKWEIQRVGNPLQRRVRRCKHGFILENDGRPRRRNICKRSKRISKPQTHRVVNGKIVASLEGGRDAGGVAKYHDATNF